IADYLTRSDAAAVVVRAGAKVPLAIDRLPRLSPDDFSVADEARPISAVPADPEAPAYIVFTSGTSGPPKGGVAAHRGVTRLVLDTNYISIGKDDKLLLLSPLTFDASTFEIWGALLNGATLVVYPEPVFDPGVLKGTIRDENVSILFLTTALFHLIV